MLLYSAARLRGDRTIAVVLSGNLRDATNPLVALFQARESRMLRAARLITDHVLPLFQPEPR